VVRAGTRTAVQAAAQRRFDEQRHWRAGGTVTLPADGKQLSVCTARARSMQQRLRLLFAVLEFRWQRPGFCSQLCSKEPKIAKASSRPRRSTCARPTPRRPCVRSRARAAATTGTCRLIYVVSRRSFAGERFRSWRGNGARVPLQVQPKRAGHSVGAKTERTAVMPRSSAPERDRVPAVPAIARSPVRATAIAIPELGQHRANVHHRGPGRTT